MAASPEARLKAYTDGWIHQNTLMWSRLQPLYFVQISYFALVTYTAAKGHFVATGLLILITWLLIGYIACLVAGDRGYRDAHGEKLYQEFKIDILEYGKPKTVATSID